MKIWQMLVAHRERLVVAAVVSGLGLCAGLTGCEPSQSSQIVGSTATPAAEALDSLWPAYAAPDYLKHGYAAESEYRDNAVAAARAAGFNAIRFNGAEPPNDEIAMHILHFKSPVDGHMLDASENFWGKAQAAGITRWVIDLGDGSTMERWRFLTKDYPANTIQWIVNGLIIPQ